MAAGAIPNRTEINRFKIGLSKIQIIIFLSIFALFATSIFPLVMVIKDYINR